MGLLVEACLRDAGRRAGGYLHRFADSSVHTGSEEAFWGQFRVVLALPAIRVPGEAKPLSFEEAVAVCRIAERIPDEGGLVNDLGRLIGGPVISDTGIRKAVAWPRAAADIAAMLETPAMRIYIQTDDAGALESAARRLAAGRPVRFGSDRIEARQSAEQFRPMELGASVTCLISYSLLRLLTFDPSVRCYQAEAYVRAI